MSFALNNVNAWEEVFSLFKKQIPSLANASAADYHPALIKQHPTDANRVQLAITAKNPDVVKGNIVVNYERANLQKLINRFADQTKKPDLNLSIVPGTKYKISQFIDVLNSVLGTALVVKGTAGYYDIVDSEFTAPDKNGIVTVNIATDVIPTDGAFTTMPLRVSNATAGQINIGNRGVTIDKVIADRGLNPFVNADGTINGGFEPINISDPKPSILLKLYNMDFSELFGTTALFNSQFRNTSSSNYYPAQLTVSAIRAINDKFAREGIPTIPENRVEATVDIVPSGNYTQWRIDSLELISSGDQYRKSFIGKTKDPFLGMSGYGTPTQVDRYGVSPGHINKAFKYYVRLAPLGAITDSYGKMPKDNLKIHDKLPINQRPLYLFFNDLI